MGAAAFISAVDEGLAGINDIGVNYDEIFFSPKFPVTHYTELCYIIGYEVSKAMVDVRYILTEEGMRYDIYSPVQRIKAHILLPRGKKCTKLLLNGHETNFTCEQIESSAYINIDTNAEKWMCFEIVF